MIKTYKFKLYSSSSFKKKKKYRDLNQQVRIAGCIYNHIIAIHKRYYKYFKKYPSVFTLNKFVTKLKKQQKYLFWNQLNSQAIQNVVERMDFGYQKFFRKENKRPPSFRSINKFKSFTLKQCGYKLFEEDAKIKIGKKVFKYHKSRDIESGSKIKNVIVKKDTLGHFYIYFVVVVADENMESTEKRIETGETAGFDFGLKTFLTGSDGNDVIAPEFFKRGLKLIKKANKNLSSKQIGSNNRKKARLNLARAHKKIANQRLDFHFKTACSLCLKYDSISLETLNLNGMKCLWGRKISDLGFGQFVTVLKHQAGKLGTELAFVDKWFPSTKMCSNCFQINDNLTLADREWTCPFCGHHHIRDFNSAKNIHREGTSSLRLGDRRLPLTRKQSLFDPRIPVRPSGVGSMSNKSWKIRSH